MDNVTGVGFEKILFEVALGLLTIDAEVGGPNVERAEDAGQPEFGCGFSFGEFGPGEVGEPIKNGNQIPAEQAVGLFRRKNDYDGPEENRQGRVFGKVSRESQSGFASQPGPAIAREVSEDEQGFPNVGGAIAQPGGDGRFGAGDLGLVNCDKSGATLDESGGIEILEAIAGFMGGFALHAEDDATIGERVGEAADGGNGLGTPAGKAGKGGGRFRGGVVVPGTGGEVGDAEDEGGFTVVTGVENATKIVVSVEVGVAFVDEEGGLHFLNDAKKGGGTDVGCDHGFVDEHAEDVEQGGFAAAFLRRFDAEIGADVAKLEGVGVESPES